MKISDILNEEEMKEIKSPFKPADTPLSDKPDMKMEEGEEETDPESE